MTALRLAARGLPHPRTAHVGAAADLPLEFPVVVKPRFGSWGRDVSVCRSRSALERCLRDLGRKAWFRRQGALVQELVQPQGYDLRILVAAGEIVGAVRRVAARGEWRTNIALGGGRSAADPPAQACLLALGAAAALETDLVGAPGRPRWLGRPRAKRRSRFHARLQPGRRECLRACRANARGDKEPSGVRVCELLGERSRAIAIVCTGNTAEEAPRLQVSSLSARRSRRSTAT
jgi:RimK-like ATP-grasp domain